MMPKGTCRIDIPSDDTRQAYDALEIRLRLFFAQDRKYLLALSSTFILGGEGQAHVGIVKLAHEARP
jgi:hypothetical protein